MGQAPSKRTLDKQPIKYVLSNDELAAAITVAHQRENSTTECGMVWLEHLKALLVIQLDRAKLKLLIDNDKVFSDGRWLTDGCAIWPNPNYRTLSSKYIVYNNDDLA